MKPTKIHFVVRFADYAKNWNKEGTLLKKYIYIYLFISTFSSMFTMGATPC